MVANSRCALCGEQLGPILSESRHWRLVLNRNQDLLGKCFLALRRHREAVSELTPAEWTDLHQQLGITTRTLQSAFRPDHFNYAFLQNQDRHVHLHVIPRYGSACEFADEVFVDLTYGDHYIVGGPGRTLRPEAVEKMAKALRQALRAAQEEN